MKIPKIKDLRENIILVWIIAVVIVSALILAVIRITNVPESQPGNSQVSSQQAIDKSLSPQPTVTTPIPPSTTPAITYSGCELSLYFQITSGDLSQAGNVQYQLVSKNIGNITCESASVSIYYASNETFVSSNPAATADGYYWQFGNLSPGEEKDISLTTNRSAGLSSGDSPNEACLSADNGTDACSNASSDIPPPATAPAVATVNNLSPQLGKELGIWVWTPVDQMSSAVMQQTINEVSENNFNVIYLTVDDYLSIDPSNTSAQNQYDEELNAFLSMAAQKGITVDAESGSSDWALPSNQSEPQEIMAFVAEYNSTHTNKFRGIQYDIEPYLLPQYNNDQADILTDYVELTSKLESEAASYELPLTMVLPHFFDDVIQWTPEITVNGATNYPYELILAILNKGTGNRVIIMAYRNFATGSDGSISLSQTEVSEADTSNVKVLVAQETGPVQPSYVTFYGMSLSTLATQVSLINKQFDSDKSFGGIAIDYLNPFLVIAGN